MHTTDGLKRGDVVEVLGTSIQVPVGEAVLGRIFNTLGEPIDNGPAVVDPKLWSIYRPAPSFQDLSNSVAILETGLKVIDLMTPILK
jgi:F-type H+-transporting ATPase subunit beta